MTHHCFYINSMIPVKDSSWRQCRQVWQCSSASFIAAPRWEVLHAMLSPNVSPTVPHGAIEKDPMQHAVLPCHEAVVLGAGSRMMAGAEGRSSRSDADSLGAGVLSIDVPVRSRQIGSGKGVRSGPCAEAI